MIDSSGGRNVTLEDPEANIERFGTSASREVQIRPARLQAPAVGSVDLSNQGCCERRNYIVGYWREYGAKTPHRLNFRQFYPHRRGRFAV